MSRVGRESQRYNLLSGRLITDVVKTSLGPRGMEKMYVDILGEDTLTGHGGAFLRKIDTTHPAAKSVIEAVNTVDTHVGDGTTTTAVLIGDLLKNAQVLLESGITTTNIIRGYELGMEWALDLLDEIEIQVDRSDVMMRNIVTTCMMGKALYELQDERMDVVQMIIDAAYTVLDLQTWSLSVDDIKIEEKLGNIADTCLVNGTVIDKTIDSSVMIHDIKDARILLINEPLETMRTKSESEISISSPEQMSIFLKQEDTDLLNTVNHIVQSGANVVISRKGVNELVQEALVNKGITSVRRVKYNDLWWLEKATGAKTCDSISNIRSEEIGFANHVYQRDVGGDKMIFVECNAPRSVTVLLRSNSKRYLDEFHRNILNAFYALRNFISNPNIVYGGGAAEMMLSNKIRHRTAMIEDKRQLVLEKFADSIESIVLTLAQNVGMDPLDTKVELHRRYNASDGWYGIDQREIVDVTKCGIVETSDVKRQVFKTAVEATNMILNIDDVFMKDLIDNTHCHIDGTVHAHHDGGKAHNHFEQEGLEQRQMHHYY